MPRTVHSNEKPGFIKAFGGGTIPEGYLACDGSTVFQASYTALWAAIGTTYNTGGEILSGLGANFRLPDSRGRALIGDGLGLGLSARNVGDKVGAETHPLSATESGVPAHDHPASAGVDSPDHSHPYTSYNFSSSAGLQSQPGPTTSTGASTDGASARHSHVITVNNNAASGAADAHNNMQPSLVIKAIIKF